MEQSDIALGTKLRLVVDLGEIRTGAIGIVSQIAQEPWRFWLCWPVGGDKRYSLCFNADNFPHFELIEKGMSEGEVAVMNYSLIEVQRQRRRGRYPSQQLDLPLSDSEYFSVEES